MNKFIIEGSVLGKYIGDASTVVIPDGIKQIGSRAFARCGMRNVVLPEGLEDIEEEAFLRCDSLNSITIPSTTKHIGSRAFWGCSKLKHVFISSDVNIDERAFNYCEMLADENGLTIINGELFNCTKGGNIVVPEGVRRIRKHAFCGIYKEINSIRLPKTLVSIDSDAYKCMNKVSVRITPNTMDNEYGTFIYYDTEYVESDVHNYEKKTMVYITAKTTEIEDGAFDHTSTTICAPVFSPAYRYAKKNGITFSSTGRELAGIIYSCISNRAERINSFISNKIEMQEQKRNSRLHEKRVEKYEIKAERLDEEHTAIYVKEGVPAPFNMPFYFEGSSFDNNYATEAILNISKKMDSGEGELLIVVAPTKGGKTHLLNLINATIKNIYPDKKILFEDAEPFLSEVRERVEAKNPAPVERVLESDVLILDNCTAPGENDRIDKKTLEISAHVITKNKGSICVYAFSDERLKTFDEIESLCNAINCDVNTYFLYLSTDTDEITKHYYAREYAQKNGYSIDKAQLNHIAERAKSLAEVREKISEYCTKKD